MVGEGIASCAADWLPGSTCKEEMSLVKLTEASLDWRALGAQVLISLDGGT